MEPGRFASETLARLNPLARLAWAGRKRQTPDELNPGNFCLVQLYPMRMVGSLEEPNINQELWDVTTRANAHGQVLRQAISRGPIFNKKGGLTRDWDTLFYVPIYVAKFVDYGLADSAISHGGFKPMIERWATNMRIRVQQSIKERGKVLKSQVNEISEGAADRMWHSANKANSTSSDTTTREERVAAQKQLEKQRSNFEGYYDGSKIWRGE